MPGTSSGPCSYVTNVIARLLEFNIAIGKVVLLPGSARRRSGSPCGSILITSAPALGHYRLDRFRLLLRGRPHRNGPAREIARGVRSFPTQYFRRMLRALSTHRLASSREGA